MIPDFLEQAESATLEVESIMGGVCVPAVLGSDLPVEGQASVTRAGVRRGSIRASAQALRMAEVRVFCAGGQFSLGITCTLGLATRALEQFGSTPRAPCICFFRLRFGNSK